MIIMTLMVVILEEKLRYGENCESSCKKGEKDYYWCWTGWNMNEVFFSQILMDGWMDGWMKTDENG